MNEFVFENDVDIEREVKRFKRFLKKEDVSENTILSYTWTLNYFLNAYKKVSNNNLLLYKGYLMDNFSPSTVNQRIQALNKYIKWNNMRNIKPLKSVKIQQKPYLENVISMQDYLYLKRNLKKSEDFTYYFLVWAMGCTGARISEILKIKVENVVDGQIDFYGKGKKSRRIYFVKHFQSAVLKWLESIERRTGYVFVNPDNGKQMTIKGIEKHLKTLGKRYNIDPSVMYPHSFRHMFGKNFYDKERDLPLLADIMGHSSIETTRIYTRRTAQEQKQVMEKIVNW